MYLVPPETGSTMCLFSGPEVNADTRPSLGSTDRFSFDPSSMNINLSKKYESTSLPMQQAHLPPVKSLLYSDR